MAESMAGWKLETTDSGIRSYSNNSKGRNLLQFRAITTVDAPVYVVGTVVRDLPSYPQWMASCKQSRVVEMVDENNLTAHITLAVPVISDRDLVVQAKTAIDLTRARSTVELIQVKSSAVPVARGVVRMPIFSGGYVFEFLGPEKTGVIYTYSADPGGSIPSVVSNWFSKNLLVETLKNMKIMVRRPSYRTMAEGSNDKALWDGALKDPAQVKIIVKNRLEEYFQDRASIDELVDRIDIVDHFLSQNNGIAELLFDSISMPFNLRRAAHLLLLTFLTKLTDDRSKAEGLANDPVLIDTLLNGPKADQPAVHEIIAGHLPPVRPTKKKTSPKKQAQPKAARKPKK